MFSPKEDGEGYIFAITLIPHAELRLPKIRQHYSFLIDRSNSIQKERLTAVKAAILKSLEELDLEDSFNIIAFDSKIEKLSSAPLPATSSSLASARKFLDEIQLGSFFSTTNLCKPLLLTIPSFQDDGLHTAILFSDGEPLNKKPAQRELALEWTAYNNGRVSLFAIGVGGDAHLATLDAITAYNRGKIVYPPTKRGIKRKLLKLMKTIKHPVAKNLTATAISRSSQVHIDLYPKSAHMPSLYLNEPYVILGTIDKLDDFILFVQGKLKDRWLNIKKTISFIHAKKADSSLKAEWALQQAYDLYEKYLYDLNPSHLAEAQSLLDPHELQVAFQ
jgi:Ca-activated chloride channel family protein